MRLLLTIFGIMALAGAAFAGNELSNDIVVTDTVPCDLTNVCLDWDFSVGDHDFTPYNCEPGGAAVWAYGNETVVPGSPGNVWGTVINGNYVNNSGDGLSSPLFTVTTDCYLMEINHYVHIETNYDGGNVSVNGQVVPPMTGYPAVISTSTSFYAYCVDMEEGFTGNGYSGASETWVPRCFDLSPFMGQTIHVDFDFGSDSSVTYPGWYLAYVKVGGMSSTPVESSTWGAIKDSFR